MGDSLYRFVQAYEAFGHHRVGSPNDRDTVEWLREELERRGAEVTSLDLPFDRYAADWSVTLDGEPVEALPLFYEGTGRIDTKTPLRRPAASYDIQFPHGVGTVSGYADIAAEAKAGGHEVVLFSTPHPHGLLQVMNRHPEPGTGLPAVQIAGEHDAHLAEASVRVQLDARLEPAVSTNLVAHFGRGAAEDTVVLTTASSGWFACAGERATGLAMALELATELAARHPVMLCLFGGHELAGLGWRAMPPLAEGYHAIVHLGACLACFEGWGPGASRDLATRPVPSGVAGPPEAVDAAQQVLAGLAWPTNALDPHEPAGWLGEAVPWVGRSDRLLSLLGFSPVGHTPQDRTEDVTTPELCDEVYRAIAAACEALVG